MEVVSTIIGFVVLFLVVADIVMLLRSNRRKYLKRGRIYLASAVIFLEIAKAILLLILDKPILSDVFMIVLWILNVVIILA